jgi:hypothetical protein
MNYAMLCCFILLEDSISMNIYLFLLEQLRNLLFQRHRTWPSSAKSFNPQIFHFLIDCDRRFPKKSLLKDHLFQHRNVRPFKCDEMGCSAAFYTPFKLKRHQSSVHTQVRQSEKLQMINPWLLLQERRTEELPSLLVMLGSLLHRSLHCQQPQSAFPDALRCLNCRRSLSDRHLQL